jgi:hypothetical protein
MDKLPLEIVLPVEVAPMESWEVQHMEVLHSEEEPEEQPAEQPMVPLKEVAPDVEVPGEFLVEQLGGAAPEDGTAYKIVSLGTRIFLLVFVVTSHTIIGSPGT